VSVCFQWAVCAVGADGMLLMRFLRERRLPAWVSRIDWIALSLAMAIGVMLGTLSVKRYTSYNASMLDIGNMSQAIWSATQGRPLEYTHEDGTFSRLAWHVEVAYFLLAPLYALWPDPRTLLVTQMVLYTLGAWPAYRLAIRHLGERGLARVLMLCYLMYPVAQTAVLADLHGDTLAMPLLLFALDALYSRKWHSYAAWIALALLCKIYVAVPVVVLGIVLCLQRKWRIGLSTVVAGGLWGLFAVSVIGPAFALNGVYQAHTTLLTYFTFYFGRVGELLWPTAMLRLLNAFIVFAPVAWLGLYAPLWMLPALAVAIPALVGVGDVITYDYRFHHYALAVPFFYQAMVAGAASLRRRQEALVGRVRCMRRGRPWRGEIWLTFGVILILSAGLVDTPLSPQFWLGIPGRGRDQWAYGRTSRDIVKDAWLAANIPVGSPVAASEFLAPHLANRPVLYLVRYPYGLKALGQPDSHHESVHVIQHQEDLAELFLAENLPRVDYVVADALFDHTRFLDPERSRVFYGTLYDVPGIMLVMRDPAFGLVAAQDGILLFSKDPPKEQVLEQRVEIEEVQGFPPLAATFDDVVGMLDVKVEALGGRRFRIQYEWMALQSLVDRDPLIAVSRLEGTDNMRIVHLPTLALHPTVAWQPGNLVRETFDVDGPADLDVGRYDLWVGWYDSSHPYASAADARSRVGDEIKVGMLTID